MKLVNHTCVTSNAIYGNFSKFLHKMICLQSFGYTYQL